MNKRTEALTDTEYEKITRTVSEGWEDDDGTMHRGNPRIAAVLILERNLGCRLGDILTLRLAEFSSSRGRIHLQKTEQKTGKTRTFTVPADVYSFVLDYCSRCGITDRQQQIFQIGERAVQTELRKAVLHMGLDADRTGTHSFRKTYATEAYRLSGNDIVLVQRLLQHASASTTQRYLSITEDRIEDVIEQNTSIPPL